VISAIQYFVLYLSHSCSSGFSLSVFVKLDPATQKCKVSKSRLCCVYRRTSYIKHTWCFDSARSNTKVNTVVNSTTLCCVAVSLRHQSMTDISLFAVTDLMQNLTQQKCYTFEDIVLYIFSETCNIETRIYSKLLHWYICI
jgi:hypothetical protein